jgi:hypothetical protein
MLHLDPLRETAEPSKLRPRDRESTYGLLIPRLSLAAVAAGLFR